MNGWNPPDIGFEDEAGSGNQYRDYYAFPIFAPDGIPRRIVVRHTKSGKAIERFSVSLEERRDGVFGSVIRYDDHLGFHRHAPGWPVPGPFEEDLSSIPRIKQMQHAVQDIARRFSEFERTVFSEKEVK